MHAARGSVEKKGRQISLLEAELWSLPTEYTLQESRDKKIDARCKALAIALLGAESVDVVRRQMREESGARIV